MSITFSSCFYIIKSKFDSDTYVQWMSNFLSIVNNFHLVIYTDETSCKYINTKENKNIRIVIKPIDQFYNYKFKENWIENHEKNILLNDKSCWELNMLWSEKIWFVKETAERNYFGTDLYGWCDIGYFRNRPYDLNICLLSNWPCKSKLMEFSKDKIHYACINNNDNFINYLHKLINDKNEYGLPKQSIPPYQNSIAGGFFIIHKDLIDWWTETYNTKLELYFKHNYLVKDDQIILVDCILSNLERFTLYRENNRCFDNWFMFQRILFKE